MCGISGIIYKDLNYKKNQRFRDAANLSKHRGPDFTGFFNNNKIEMVHHRLSILDLDERSHQPFTGNNDKTPVLIYNGEIYNYRELALKYSLNLNTSSDTEVLFQLLQNPQFDLKELNGIFAFGLYDKRQNLVRITRDRLGVKPLYYYNCNDYFIFSSEAKVIYAYLDNLKLNYTALSEYLTFGHTVSEQTIVDGVKKLDPGTSLIIKLSDFSIIEEKYWSIEKYLLKSQIIPSYDEALTTTRELLQDAVKRQCVSDVQVGAYLSGGIDSSAVVALASRFTDRKLNTYSVNFDKNPNSELKLASKLAKKYETNHHEFEVNTDSIEEYLYDLVFQYDEPFADPAMIPLHLIADKASEFSKVVLQGDGGDEIFAGYGRHLDLQQYHYRKWIFKFLKSVYPDNAKRRYYSKRFDKLNYSSHSKIMASLAQDDLDKGNYKVLKSDLHEKVKDMNPLTQYEVRDKRFQELPFSQKMLYTDMEIILPHKFLEKVDKVNMYHSIEARVPLLDNDLVDYVACLPHSLKIKKSTTKYFFRDVLKGIVPDEILSAQKSSFGTPISEWLKTTLYNYAMDQFNKGEKEGLPLDFTMIKTLLQNHKSNSNSAASGIIWRTLVLTIWMSQYQNKLVY